MIEFIRRRNAALWSYRRRKVAGPAAGTGVAGPAPVATPPNVPPAWATGPTVAVPRPGRAGWLTPAQTWRANGGRW
ncbi:hypothetical protein ACFY3U_27475 [Micromonospora sp. NPDC000089]|uniref:hypothetical protein n=1 Tax=unclassified Micromonospora TaxID=2617518 RepID=UPI0036B12ADB